MDCVSSTIRELLIKSETAYGALDAFRYKVKRSDEEGKKAVEIESKTYTQLRNDSECFSAALETLGEQKSHIAIVGNTSYEWVVSYMGVVNSGSVAVPLDSLLPTEELCDLINRADVTTLVFDESKAEVANVASKDCPKLKNIISMSNDSKVESALSLWKLIGEQKTGCTYEPSPEDLATIMFTSGTTGKSKGVMLTHRTDHFYTTIHAENADAAYAAFADRILYTQPAYNRTDLIAEMRKKIRVVQLSRDGSLRAVTAVV